jgi:hypothetical protein
MKKCLSLLFFFLFAFASSSFAATMPDYPPDKYGEANIPLRGDLSPSGIGTDDQRPSTVYWHAVRFQNAISNDQYPTDGSYIPTVSYDIQEQLATDNFANREGYHLLPIDESTIKRYAGYMNGNQDYVWQQVQAASNKLYQVDRRPYISFPQVAYWCGAGEPDMKQLSNDGVTNPLFQTTYKTTPWPYIEEFSPNNGNLNISAKAYSIYDAKLTAWIMVNGDPSTNTQVFTQSTGANNYAIPFNDANFSIAPIEKYLKPGDNKLTLTISDGYNRTTSKDTTFTYGPIVPQNNLKVISLTSNPNPLQQGGSGSATAVIQNESNVDITTPVTFTADGNQPQTQMITLKAGGQQTLTFSFKVPEKNTIYMKAEVNPNHDQPANETSYADNVKDLAVSALAQKPNTQPEDPSTPTGNLKALFPSGQGDIRESQTTDIYVDVADGGYFDPFTGDEIPITTDVDVTVSYPGYSQTFSQNVTLMSPGKRIKVTVPTPHYDAFKQKYTALFPANAHIDMNVQVNVNPDHSVSETSYDDNQITGTVPVSWLKFKLVR